MSEEYSVNMTNSDNFGTLERSNSMKFSSTKTRVSCLARSARKFMKITTSLSEIGGYFPAPTSVGFTNSSSSPLSYAAFNAVSASLNENSLLDSVNNS